MSQNVKIDVFPGRESNERFFVAEKSFLEGPWRRPAAAGELYDSEEHFYHEPAEVLCSSPSVVGVRFSNESNEVLVRFQGDVPSVELDNAIVRMQELLAVLLRNGVRWLFRVIDSESHVDAPEQTNPIPKMKVTKADIEAKMHEQMSEDYRKHGPISIHTSHKATDVDSVVLARHGSSRMNQKSLEYRLSRMKYHTYVSTTFEQHGLTFVRWFLAPGVPGLKITGVYGAGVDMPLDKLHDDHPLVMDLYGLHGVMGVMLTQGNLLFVLDTDNESLLGIQCAIVSVLERYVQGNNPDTVKRARTRPNLLDPAPISEEKVAEVVKKSKERRKTGHISEVLPAPVLQEPWPLESVGKKLEIPSLPEKERSRAVQVGSSFIMFGS